MLSFYKYGGNGRQSEGEKRIRWSGNAVTDRDTKSDPDIDMNKQQTNYVYLTTQVYGCVSSRTGKRKPGRGNATEEGHSKDPENGIEF